jgi:hypothetical protein
MQEINYESKLFFSNIYTKNDKGIFTNLPPESSKDFEDLVKWEREKCTQGLNVNGVHIPGSIYYLKNHHYIDFDSKNSFGKTETKIGLGLLRDNEWHIHNNYNQCRNEGKGYILFGARQLSKTSTEVCIAMHELNFNKNAEVLALFATDKDKQTFTKKLKIASQNNTYFLTHPTIDKDFSKDLIRFGFKQPDNTDFEFSKIYIYLTDEGRNTEAGAGKTPTLFIMDETCKHPFLKVNEGVIPAMMSQIPGEVDRLKGGALYTATGGQNENTADGKELFNNPESYFCKSFDDDKTGDFLSGEYRAAFKFHTTFGDFIKRTRGITIENKEIRNLDFYETDHELAKKTLDEAEELAKKTSMEAFIARKIYAPRKKTDMFVSGKSNMFAHLSEEIERVIYYLENDAPANKFIDFRLGSDNTVQVIPSSKSQLTEFPHKNLSSYQKDTSFIIKSEPRKALRAKLYYSGADFFNTTDTAESASLGSFYVLQGDTTNPNDLDNSSIVAWYDGRKDIEHIRRLVLGALIYYGGSEGNITLLHEAADDNTTQWFIQKNLGYLLTDTPEHQREINSATKARNVKGIRPTPRTQKYYLQAMLDYFEEELTDGRLGLWRIPSVYLLRQVLNFSGDLGPNDAMVAFGHALMDMNINKKYGQVKVVDEKQEVVVERRPVRSIFGNHSYRKKSII